MTTKECPLDTWVLRELLYEVKPDVMVETGTYTGGSSYYCASLMELMRHGRVLSARQEITLPSLTGGGGV